MVIGDDDMRGGYKPAPPKTPSVMDANIRELDLSVATKEVLGNAGITTVRQLVALREAELAAMPGIGVITFNRIANVVRSMGLKFRRP